jgi:hypothetical protein
MQQRQPRLGDVLDDYCPRERRVTNHVVVAMINDDVKQTRCTTCDADHDYKQAKVPRVRRRTEPPAALAAQGFGVPKLHDASQKPADDAEPVPASIAAAAVPALPVKNLENPENPETDMDADGNVQQGPDEGPVHRRLIRASLPRTEGQAPPTRPNPEFTIRQPNNSRQNRFRPRHGGPGQNQGRGGGGPMQSSGNGNRSFGGGFPQRQHGGGGGGNPSRRHGGGGGGRNRGK